MASNVTPSTAAIQYTGSNGAAIDAAVSPFIDFVLVSESGGVLQWTSNGNPNSATVGDWILYNVNGVNWLSSTLFQKEWMCTALCSELATTDTAVAALDVRVDDLESGVATLSASVAGAFVRAMGVAPVPSLLASGTATVAVQLQPAMPDSSYSAFASKFAGISLTDLNITSVTVVDADTVDVGVENVGLLTLTGATVMVHAID